MTLYTSKHSFPKPEATEAPNGPLQIGALADAIDAKIPFRSKGRSIIETAQTVNPSNGVNTMLGTPDQITGLVVPAEGLLFVSFSALFTVPASAQVAAKIIVNNGADDGPHSLEVNGPTLDAGKVAGAAGQYPIYTGFHGTTGQGRFFLDTNDAAGGWSDDSDSPLIVGAFIPMVAEDQTEQTVTVKVAVRRVSGSGSLGMEQRRLFAYTVGF